MSDREDDDTTTAAYMLGFERGKAAALRAAAEREKELREALALVLNGVLNNVGLTRWEYHMVHEARTILAKHEKPAPG